MKNSISKILVILIILVYAVGCGKRSLTTDNQTSNTKNTDFTLSVESMSNEENGFVKKISTTADLNGDGKAETIFLLVKKNPNGEEVNAIELHVEEKMIAYEGEMIDPLFKIVDIFTVKNTKSILARDIIENSGTIPYLTASQSNNSVGSYIDYNIKLRDTGNCIFIGGKTFVVTYQERDFFSNDSHNLALYLKNTVKKTKENQLYIASAIYKSLCSKYSWGNSISYKKIQKDIITLPVDRNGNPDYDYMTNFIRIQEKLAIINVVDWKDKEINYYNKVVVS